MLCSEQTSVNRNNHEGVCSVLRCKKWDCDLCRPYNRHRVIKKALQGNPTSFLTLTCNPGHYETPDEAARDLKRAWIVLRRRAEVAFGIKKIPFIVIFERTKHGWPHMHMLIRARWISQKWLSDNMRDLIDAPIVDIRRIQDNGRAAKYVAKYLGKEPHAFKGCKRWWRSHNYKVEEDDVMPKIDFGSRWEVVDCNYDTYLQRLAMFGAEITEERPGYCHFRSRYYEQ